MITISTCLASDSLGLKLALRAEYKHASDFLRDWFCGMKSADSRTLPLLLLEEGQRRGVIWRSGPTVGSQVSDRKKVVYYLLDRAGIRHQPPSMQALRTACEELHQQYVAVPRRPRRGRRQPFSMAELPKMCFPVYTFCCSTFEREVFGWSQAACKKSRCICKAPAVAPAAAAGI